MAGGVRLLLCAALLLAGCGDSEEPASKRIAADGQYFDYPDVGALAADSDVVAEVIVTKELFKGEVREVPSTIFQARVIEGFKNAAAGDLLRIKQWTDLEHVEVDSELQEPLEPGARYLVFLWEMFPGHTARGDEQLVGLLGPVHSVGLFRETGDASRFELVPGVPGVATRIPRAVTKHDVATSLRPTP